MPTPMAQDTMVREREGTGVILIFKIGQGGPLWSPSASTRHCQKLHQPGRWKLTDASHSSGLLMREPEGEKKEDLHPYTGQIHYLNLKTSSILVRGVDGNKDVFFKCSVPSVSPNIWHPRSHPQLWNLGDTFLCRHLTEPASVPHPHPTPKVKFRLPSWKTEVNIQDCFWQGISSNSNPTVGCLPSFPFSKGAKASFRK